jgi:hypothetical protein
MEWFCKNCHWDLLKRLIQAWLRPEKSDLKEIVFSSFAWHSSLQILNNIAMVYILLKTLKRIWVASVINVKYPWFVSPRNTFSILIVLLYLLHLSYPMFPPAIPDTTLGAMHGFPHDYPTMTHNLTAVPVCGTTLRNTVSILNGYICICGTPCNIWNILSFFPLARPGAYNFVNREMSLWQSRWSCTSHNTLSHLWTS